MSDEKELKGEKEEKQGFWMSVASFIVDKRKAIEILFLFFAVYCLINMNRVQVNQDITSYLPATSETRVGLTTMEDQFVTYGSARVMVGNISYEEATALQGKMEQIAGVKQVAFEQNQDHFVGSNALFDVTVVGGDDDAESIKALQDVEELLAGYDVYVSSAVGATERSMDALGKDMNMILGLAVLIIVLVLLISTKAFLEIPVLLITFGAAALLNKGTNYWFGEISSVTNSIAVVLQLALAIDYAIILCDRYMEEHETLPPVEACKVALSKAIPEISSSSLTTVSGMAAMMFMQFRLGFDMGIVLVKAILFSLIAVFFLMPGVILIFAKGIDKTMHRSFVPKISFVGKFASLTKYVIPPVFLVVIIAAFYSSSNCTYLYDVNSVPSATLSQEKIASNKIEGVFGKTNQLVVMVPVGDYEKEAKLAADLEKQDYIVSVLALANQSVNEDYTVTTRLTPRQFAELADLDVEVARVLYMAYAYSEETYGPVVTGIDDYSVPIIDMFLFLYDQYQEGYVTLSADLDKTLTELYDKLHDGQLQLKGDAYSRMVLNFDMPVEGEATYEKMDAIREIAGKYYDKGSVILVGNSTSANDLASSFATDNIIISVLTALFVLIILFFTFQSAGLPVLLVLTIQGSIWINFTVPSLEGEGIYFIAYLIVSAIQMGATIDYAIVISSRYLDLKNKMSLKQAITETLNQAFPTIFTSGTILTGAGFLIGEICSDATVAAIGIALGRGTLISIILVLFVLPQILLLGDYIIEKTALSVKLGGEQHNLFGRMVVNGYVHGEFHGTIDGEVKGVLTGDLNASVSTRLPGHFAQAEELPQLKPEEKQAFVPEQISSGVPNNTEGKSRKKGLGNAVSKAWKKLFIGVFAVSMLFSLSSAQSRAEELPEEEATQETLFKEENVIEITNVKQFIDFAIACQDDSYSLGVTFELMSDLNLNGSGFNGIPVFRGTFEGNGHTIKGVTILEQGTNMGFFRYIGQEGCVKELIIYGTVDATGTAQNVGGIVGNNKGQVISCEYHGSVAGKESVGGIAGICKENGILSQCKGYALVLGTDFTGGVVGTNAGLVQACENHGEVNVEELEATFDMGGIDLGSLNLTENLATRSDMGGIAGTSEGILSECVNYGTVGFEHSGYNVGGIAGSQKGIILNCTNHGKIMGRKDVGGIVGQAEPYVESDYLEDKIDEVQGQVDDLNKTLTGINATIRNTSDKTLDYAEKLTIQTETSTDQVSQLTASIDAQYPEAKEYTDAINEANEELKRLNAIDNPTEDDLLRMQEELRIINDNLNAIQENYSDNDAETKDVADAVTSQLQKNPRYDDTKQMMETLDKGIQGVTRGVDKAIAQMNGIRDTVSDGFAVITGDDAFVMDISSVETAQTMNGVISGCINDGRVTGDLCVGGIAGTMNVEFNNDPEYDVDFTKRMNLVLRSTANDVLADCVNNGLVHSKRDNAGGIVGLHSLGLVYHCEGYGDVGSDSGAYLGGIAGLSDGALQNCYSLCSVKGEDFLGGITGRGSSVAECVSIPTILGSGEALGSLIGWLSEESMAKDNCYVGEDFGGIDNINYAGIAERRSYDQVRAMEGVPDRFRKVTATFLLDGEVVEQRNIVYGGSLTKSYFPKVASQEGYYVVWNADVPIDNVIQNATIEAEYVPWTTALESEEKADNGRNLFLAVGEFYGGSKVKLSECEKPYEEGGSTQYAYAYEVNSSEKAWEAQELEGHFYIPDATKQYALMVAQKDSWNRVETTVDGSYLVAKIPVQGSFALVELPKEQRDYSWCIAVAAGVAVGILLAMVVGNARKKRKAAKESSKQA